MLSEEDQIFLNVLEGRIYRNGDIKWLFAQEMLHYPKYPGQEMLHWPGYPFYVWRNGDWQKMTLHEIKALKLDNEKLMRHLASVNTR